ncbi:hypothetical protein Mgra_00002516 [Meloidogyne graminicola]|uniref:glucuronosyltransferase n=1 Tax=Meloidogyne graminicola TaxID=189291 RepID=A0A8S9ZYS4_9BILA|nr:hypothetical protein Mgra_00002516 [Meloidogyne graminicola]
MLHRPLIFLLGMVSLFMPGAAEKKLKALVVAPNFLDMHFKMNSVFANKLAENNFNVHFLILNTKGKEKGENFNVEVNETFQEKTRENQGGNTYEIVDFNLRFTESLKSSIEPVSDKFKIRGNGQNQDILENEAVRVFKELAKNNRIVGNLSHENFDVAFFDTWDFGALKLFQTLNIKNVFGINNIQLNAFQLLAPSISHSITEMKISEQLKTVPEIYSAKPGNHNYVFNKKWDDVQLSNYRNSAEMFYNVYSKLGNDIVDLYKNVKGIFLNSFELIDFPLLEYYKKLKVHYVGGIHLNELKNGANKGNKSQVIISIEACDKLLEKNGNQYYYYFWHAFGAAELTDVIYDCKLDDEEKIRKLEEDNDLFNLNIKYKKIENIQHELGNTRLLMTNCSGYQAIEAIAANVQLLCLPYFVDQFYVSEALQINHNKLEGSSTSEEIPTRIDDVRGREKETNPSKGPKDRSRSPVCRKSPSRGTPRGKSPQINNQICNEGVIAPSLSFNSIAKENGVSIENVLKELVKEDNMCKKNMQKAHDYLIKILKDKKAFPEAVFINTVNEILKKEGVNKQGMDEQED